MKKLWLAVGIVLIIAATLLFLNRKTDALNSNHDCSFCHQLHNSPGQQLTANAVIEDLCLTCHGPAGTATRKAAVHTNRNNSSYSPFTMTCRNCHDAHDSLTNWTGGTNIMMVGSDQDGTGLAKITTPNSGVRHVVFESRGTGIGDPLRHSFADNDNDANSYWDGACETCHTQTYHQNDGNPIPVHHVGDTCTTCHPHIDGFLPTAGSCSDCHNNPQDNNDGPPTRRAVIGEFSMTSHHAAGGISDNDCGVCHYEAMDGTYHMNNQVDLRDPDDGTDTTLISFTQFSRNTASDVLESWVTNVQNNFCLKCHDADGATATNVSGNALQPFSSPSRNVPNVYDQFDTTNDYHHAVRGQGNNPYCIPSGSNGNSITMEPPWNQDSTHDVISCFDCHEANGHGSNNQRMTRYSVDFDAMESGNLSKALGTSVENFCSLCHKSSVYLFGGDGSIFNKHPGDEEKHGADRGNYLGCMGCHAGILDESGLSSGNNGASRGNVHGGSFTWFGSSPASPSPTDYFMLGGWLSGWRISGNRGECWGGNCAHRNRSKRYDR